MTLLLLVNLGYGGGTASTAPATLGDLTTLFTAYVNGLQNSNGYEDADTLIANDLATVIAAVDQDDDRNTQYALYLS